MQPEKIYNALLARRVIEGLQARNMEGYYCETKEEALRQALEMIPKGSVVSCGGSASLREIGLRSAFRTGDYEFLDTDDVQGARAKDDIAHKALGADYFLMSANAITASGELVNIDGYGNRTAALIFGPRNVIVIAGMNKVEPNLEAALIRARNRAAQMTMLIFKQDYASFGELAKAAESACSQTVVTSASSTKGRIKVILTGDKLGY